MRIDNGQNCYVTILYESNKIKYFAIPLVVSALELFLSGIIWGMQKCFWSLLSVSICLSIYLSSTYILFLNNFIYSFLAVLGPHYCSGFLWLRCGGAQSSPCSGFSVAEQGSRVPGLSSRGMWVQWLRLPNSRAHALQLWWMCLAAPIKDQTCVSCIGRQVIQH